MTINQLAYFVTVAEEMSITRAAELFQVSQPAVSAAIRDLEKEYDLVLFNRTKNELSLTEAGKDTYRRAKSLLEHYNAFCGSLSSMPKGSRPISLAVAPNIAAIHLADMLVYAKKKLPGITLNVQEDFIVNMTYMLRNRSIDAACFACPQENKNDELTYVPVGRLSLSFCASPGMLDLPRRTVTIEDMKDLPLVLQFKQSVLNSQIIKYYSMVNAVPKVLFHSNQVTTILSFVKKGMAGSFLPPQLVADDNSIIAYEISDSRLSEDFASFPIYFVYKHKSKELMGLCRVITEYFNMSGSLL